MRFAQDSTDDNSIQAYRSGEIIINDRVIDSSAVITPDTILAWLPQRFDEITPEHIEELAGHHPEIIILGTGARQQFLPLQFTAPLQARGIGLELMNTNAACRTFNVLLSEGRRVIAAIILE